MIAFNETVFFGPLRNVRTGEPAGDCCMCGNDGATGSWCLCDRCRREQTERVERIAPRTGLRTFDGRRHHNRPTKKR